MAETRTELKTYNGYRHRLAGTLINRLQRSDKLVELIGRCLKLDQLVGDGRDHVGETASRLAHAQRRRRLTVAVESAEFVLRTGERRLQLDEYKVIARARWPAAFAGRNGLSRAPKSSRACHAGGGVASAVRIILNRYGIRRRRCTQSMLQQWRKWRLHFGDIQHLAFRIWYGGSKRRSFLSQWLHVSWDRCS